MKKTVLITTTFILFMMVVFQNCEKVDTESTPLVDIKTVGMLPKTVFTHPGLLVGQKQIDFITTKIQAGEQPWKAAYDQLKASKYASLAYAYKAYDVVECGSYNMPNVGCNNHVEDGMAVYCLSLMYTFTKDVRYAQKAVEIINAWSVFYKQNINTNSNLVVSWATPWFVNGAEILKYNYPNWKKEDETQFIGMLDKFLPYILNENSAGNNWIQSAIEAHLSVAVFKNDTILFNKGIERWKTRVKTYIYQTSDGAKPINTQGKTDAQMASIWKSTSTGTVYVDGLCQETCRDLGHLNLGFFSMIYAAEIAQRQGIDLFSLEKKRITDFMELQASWMTGSVKVPDNICGGVVKATEPDSDGIRFGIGGGQVAWEIAYNHFHDRLKYNLPYTEKMLLKSRPQAIAKWVSKGETLTHAGRGF